VAAGLRQVKSRRFKSENVVGTYGKLIWKLGKLLTVSLWNFEELSNSLLMYGEGRCAGPPVVEMYPDDEGNR